MNTRTKYPVHSPFFWSAYFIQMRPYLLFISGIAGLSGMAMQPDPVSSGWKFFVGFILFFFAYGFGQALTDCFQTDTDKLSAPYRPLSKEIISVKNVLIVSSAFLATTGILFYLLHPVCFFLSLAAVFGLATYSYIKKNFWFAGPSYNAWIVALLPVMGFFACSGGAIKNFPSIFYPYVGISFFSYANFVLIGYLKDIEADKETGYKTFPVVFGWDKTIITGDVFAACALLLTWTQPLSSNYELIARIIATLVIIAGQVVAHLTKQENEKGALIPILSTVRGFILLHISTILHFHRDWWLACLIFYLLFEIALYLRPSKYQV